MIEKNYRKLIKKYLSGKKSSEGDRIFERWFSQINNSDKEDEGIEETEEIRKRIEHRLLQTIDIGHKEPIKISRTIPTWSWYAAASVLFLSALSILFWTNHSGSPKIISYLEKVNNSKNKLWLTLPDGSRIQLNENSKIRYPKSFLNNKRSVFLEGEAFFDVVHDSKSMFSVLSGKVETMVLGTSFNIRAYPGQLTVEVLVKSGMVSVRDTITKTFVTLLPKQRAVFEDKAGILRKDTIQGNYDVEQTGKDGEIIFNDLPLEAAIRLLHQKFGVIIILESEKLKNCRVNAAFKDKTLSEIIEDICRQTSTKCFYQKNQYFFSGNGCPTK